MIRNYLKVALRSLYRYKFFAFINVFGLSTAMAFCIVGYLNFTRHYTWDSFHTNADRIFRVESVRDVGGREVLWGSVPIPMAERLRADFAEVEKVVRYSNPRVSVRIGDHVFSERVGHVHPDFLRVFSFRLETGSPDVLQDKSRLVISRKYAEKYFGAEDPMGQTLRLRYSDTESRDFIVGAVAAAYPSNSSIRFDVLVNDEVLSDVGIDEPNNWEHWTGTLFIQTKNPEAASSIAANLDRYVRIQNSVNKQAPVKRFDLRPLADVALNSRNVTNDPLQDSSPMSAIVGPSVMAILILLLACFNYVNTSLAFSTSRIREIGMRKVVGGLRGQLVVQFLGENILLCTIALVAALAMAEFFIVGWNNLWTFAQLSADYLSHPDLMLFLVGLVLTVAIGSGLYPALYVSSFSPSRILKGREQLGPVTGLMRGLLVIQFSVAMMAMIQAALFAENAKYQENLDVGYHKDLIAVLRIENESMYTTLRAALEAETGVEQIAGGREHIGYRWNTKTVRFDNRNHEIELLRVGPDYMQTMGLRIKEGKLFDPALSSENTGHVVVNETFAHQIGGGNPIGQIVELDGARYVISGVVEDFLTSGVWRPVTPVLFRTCESSEYAFAVIRIQPGSLSRVKERLQSVWAGLYPDIPYSGFFQDDVLAESISVSQNITTMSVYIALLAIAIASMGLFALVSLSILRRTKEIGIRKILGAGTIQLLELINREFVIVLVAASLVADVAGYLATRLLLESLYAYHVNFSLPVFLLSNGLVLTIAVFTVGGLVIRAVMTNPVRALRYE